MDSHHCATSCLNGQDSVRTNQVWTAKRPQDTGINGARKQHHWENVTLLKGDRICDRFDFQRSYVFYFCDDIKKQNQMDH